MSPTATGTGTGLKPDRLVWRRAMLELSTLAAAASAQAPDAAVSRRCFSLLREASRHLPEDGRLEETNVSALAGRANGLLTRLMALVGAEGPVRLLSTGQRLLRTDRAREAGDLIGRAEAHAAEAEEARRTAAGLVAPANLVVTGEITDRQNRMRLGARAGLLDLQGAIGLLAGAREQVASHDTLADTVLVPVASARMASLALPATPDLGQPGGGRGPKLGRMLEQDFDFGGETVVVADRYEVRDVIGRGSFGTVLEAFDRRLGRLVALKVMRVPPLQDGDRGELLNRFRREAQAVARMSHPGIVPVYDFGEDEEIAWIVMELVIGDTLRDMLDRDGRLEAVHASQITIQLLEALSAAHARGVVHRDVKPANVIVVAGPSREPGRARLLDFGVAHLSTSEGTMAGEMIGTLSTMAPEQIQGEPVDARTDLWAVGVVLYRLLTGEQAFPGPPKAVIAGILAANPVPPSSRMAGLPAGFDAVIIRALAKPPERRFADAAEFIEAIRAAMASPQAPESGPPAGGGIRQLVASAFPAWCRDSGQLRDG